MYNIRKTRFPLSERTENFRKFLVELGYNNKTAEQYARWQEYKDAPAGERPCRPAGHQYSARLWQRFSDGEGLTNNNRPVRMTAYKLDDIHESFAQHLIRIGYNSGYARTIAAYVQYKDEPQESRPIISASHEACIKHWDKYQNSLKGKVQTQQQAQAPREPAVQFPVTELTPDTQPDVAELVEINKGLKKLHDCLDKRLAVTELLLTRLCQELGVTGV